METWWYRKQKARAHQCTEVGAVVHSRVLRSMKKYRILKFPGAIASCRGKSISRRDRIVYYYYNGLNVRSGGIFWGITRDPGVLFETLHDKSTAVKYCLQLQGPNINYVSYLMCVPVSVVPIIPDGRLDQNGTPPCGGYRFCRRPCSCEATIHARINLAPRRGRRRPGDHSIRIS